jgi:hypothetical protein
VTRMVVYVDISGTDPKGALTRVGNVMDALLTEPLARDLHRVSTAGVPDFRSGTIAVTLRPGVTDFDLQPVIRDFMQLQFVRNVTAH